MSADWIPGLRWMVGSVEPMPTRLTNSHTRFIVLCQLLADNRDALTLTGPEQRFYTCRGSDSLALLQVIEAGANALVAGSAV